MDILDDMGVSKLSAKFFFIFFFIHTSLHVGTLIMLPC